MKEQAPMTAAMPQRVTCVLFDLDGTLIDSAPGITHCLAETIERFGGPMVRPSSLREFVGPPVLETLRAFSAAAESRLPEVIADYRAAYLDHGLSNSSLFPGIPALLGMLGELHVPLAVATSKREDHARRILELHDIDPAFSVISGAAEDESSGAKHLVIRSALERLAASGADVSDPILIGDRSFDSIGAAALGIPMIFASWGYGAPEEAAGSVLVAEHPFEVSALLQQLLKGYPHTKLGTRA
jgi:phosphoglycolate phosphatase